MRANGCGSLSARADLARQVLEMLASGYVVPTLDAFQLRHWAIRPGDALLTLEEIANRILDQEENSNAKVAS